MSGVPADLAFRRGAGDENRTRTISLGIQPIQPTDPPELGIQRTASGRDGPCHTGANGPRPPARRPASHSLPSGAALSGHAWWSAVLGQMLPPMRTTLDAVTCEAGRETPGWRWLIQTET
jgi:hypothetical protein